MVLGHPVGLTTRTGLESGSVAQRPNMRGPTTGESRRRSLVAIRTLSGPSAEPTLPNTGAGAGTGRCATAQDLSLPEMRLVLRRQTAGRWP